MPIFSGVAALVASVGTWFAGLGAVTQAFVQIGAGLVFNKLSAALAGKAEQLKEPGIVGELQQGADVGRSFVVGRRATPGSLAYHNEWGADNEYYTRITALSDLPITGLVSIWVDGKHYQLDRQNPHADFGWPIIGLDETRTESRRIELGTNEDRGTTIYGTEEVEVTEAIGWVRFFDGTQIETASFVVDDVATEERPWDATDIGTGVANAITTFKIDRDVFQGLPELLFVVDGIAMEDPATSTAGHSENPIVIARTILNGLTFGGQWFYGPERGSRFDDVELVAEIAKCNASVPGADAMSEAERIEAFGEDVIPARYRASLEVTLDRQPADVLEDLLSACNGRASEVGTRYRLQVGDPGTPVASITDDDILSIEGQTFAPFFPLAETVNAITATYPSPVDGWQQQDAPPLYRPDLEDLDGNRRLPSGVSLSAVPFPEQVQRLMASALAEARRARRHSFVLPSEFWRLEPGDFFTFTSVRNGYMDKLFRVDGVSDLPKGDLAVDVTEVDPTDYSWQASADFQAVASGALSGLVTLQSKVQGWGVEGVTVSGDLDGVERPALALTWSAPAASSQGGLEYEVRAAVSLAAVDDGSVRDVSRGVKVVASGILGNTWYEARASFIRPGSRCWTEWVAARTPDVRFVENDISDDVWDRISSEAQDAADRANAATDDAIDRNIEFDIDDVLTGFLDEEKLKDDIIVLRDDLLEVVLEDVFTSQEDGLAEFDIEDKITDFLDKAKLEGDIQTATETLRGELDDAVAIIETDYVTAVNLDGALSTLTTTVSAAIDEVAADVTEVSTALATTDGAFAQYKLDVTAEFDDAAAATGVVATSVAGLDTAFSQYVVTTNARVGDVEADVTSVSEAYADSEAALASYKNTVSTSIGAAQSTASTALTSATSASNAVASLTTTVNAHYAENLAFASTTLNTFADVESAATTLAATLRAETTDAVSDVYDAVYTIAETDSAISGAVSTFNTRICYGGARCSG